MCTEHNYGFFIDKLSNWAAAGSLNHLLAELLLNTTRAFFFFFKGAHVSSIFEALSHGKTLLLHLSPNQTI